MNRFELDKNWLDVFARKVTDKLSVTSEQIGVTFPYTTTDGKYETFAYGATEEGYGLFWWTNGFWPGMMWLMYQKTGDEKYRKIAEGCEELLDQCFDKFKYVIHDVGMMWLASAVKNWHMTKNERSRIRGMHAATILAGRFNHKGGYIRAWEHDKYNRAIIDCMMNLPILYWASEVSGDPRFRYVAEAHADTTLKHFVRPDGSVAHVAQFNDETGEVEEYPSGQGAYSGSSWSRGQAWAIYGFAQSYMYTKKQEYLDAAKRVAHYFIANIDEELVPYVDFRVRRAGYVDTTAGVTAASGLIDLVKFVDEGEKDLYRNAAIGLLKGAEQHCRFDLAEQSILQDGVGSFGDEPMPIIYGDYFLLEALLKLQNENILPW